MKTLILLMLCILPVGTHVVSGDIDHTNDFTLEKLYCPLSIDDSIRMVLRRERLTPIVVELLVAQSKYESGYYTNSLTKFHNVFARHYHKSDTFALGSGAKAEGHSRFARFKNIKKATQSQVAYFKRKKYSMQWTSVDQFTLELKQKGYYEDDISTYTKGVKRYFVAPVAQ